MTSIATPIPDLYPSQRHSAGLKLALVIGLVALADWLFYREGVGVGISLVIFAVLLMGGSLMTNFGGLDQRRAGPAGVIFLAGLLPAIEDLNSLSFVILLGSLCCSIAMLTNPNLMRLRDWLVALRDLLLIGPFRAVADIIRLLTRTRLTAGIAAWFVTLALGSLFVLLFASANPLIETWLAFLNPENAVSQIDQTRTLFWVIAFLVLWPFVQLRWRRRVSIDLDLMAPDWTTLDGRDDDAPHRPPSVLSAPMVLRSLILFNLLFAVQTILDLIFLWGDGKLPAEITYADYAHRGAYALILAALLAAGFVLTAMRPAGLAEGSRIIRMLVYLFVAQNLMLVASSIQRLHLYVETYELTSWRVAALVWMLLVAIGLVLIVARIALKRSNDWLIFANLIGLAATLYICALINFVPMIAGYNVAHSLEASGPGVKLDKTYLVGLGPQALPAIDTARKLLPDDRCLAFGRDRLVRQQQQIMASWRSWSFQSFRLQRYLDRQQNQPASG
jgi:Domain of unknown function (DUF4173)